VISIHFVVQRMQNIGTGSSAVLLMFDDLDQEVKRNFFLAMMLIPVSFAITATLNGCSGLGSSAPSNNSTITHFEYTIGPLALTTVQSNGSAAISDAYFGMTIHRLVANPSSSRAVVPFPPFPIHTLRFWDVATWGTLEPANGQYDWRVMDGTIANARRNGVSDFILTLGYMSTWASTKPADPCGQASDSWQGLRQPGEAYANLQGWLVGASLTHCDQFEDGLWACELQRAGGYEGWILWDCTGTSHSVHIPNKLQLSDYRDWRNNFKILPEEIIVDQMPVIIEN
jgi:hypothetical protein